MNIIKRALRFISPSVVIYHEKENMVVMVRNDVTICYSFINHGSELEVIKLRKSPFLHFIIRMLDWLLKIVLAISGLAVVAEMDLREDFTGDLKYKKYRGRVIIPEIVTIKNNSFRVRSIREDAFRGCKGLTSVTIPNSVTSIGRGGFWSCTGLTAIIIENGNTKYDSRDNCNAIIETASNTLIAGCKNTIIPNSVKSIGREAFAGCPGLTSITIPDSVTSIEEEAFYGCTGLTSVNIPNSVTSIGRWAFGGCHGLTSITIPDSVTSIGEGAFRGCHGMTSITIPDSVTSIGEGAFRGCKGLTSITIPDSVTSIGEGAFRDCKGLTSVTIGKSVESIGRWAFEGLEIQEVISRIENPAAIHSIDFNKDTISKATLIVPKGTIDKYKSLWSWKRFAKIVEG